MAQGHERVNATRVRFPLEEIKYLMFSFLCPCNKAKARLSVPPHNTQCFEKSAESGERSVLTIGSIHLPTLLLLRFALLPGCEKIK